jgi:hypothetical protein
VWSYSKKSKGKFLKPTLVNIGSGYLYVNLYNSSGRKTVSVHRIVAKHFVSGQCDNLVVDHIDGNSTNNKASNLQWITQTENIRKGKAGKVAKTLHAKTYKLIHPCGTEETITNLKQYAKDNNITYQHLGRVVSGERSHYKGIRISKVEGL